MRNEYMMVIGANYEVIRGLRGRVDAPAAVANLPLCWPWMAAKRPGAPAPAAKRRGAPAPIVSGGRADTADTAAASPAALLPAAEPWSVRPPARPPAPTARPEPASGSASAKRGQYLAVCSIHIPRSSCASSPSASALSAWVPSSQTRAGMCRRSTSAYCRELSRARIERRRGGAPREKRGAGLKSTKQAQHSSHYCSLWLPLGAATIGLPCYQADPENVRDDGAGTLRREVVGQRVHRPGHQGILRPR